MIPTKTNWSLKAEKAFDSLLEHYWNNDLEMFNNHYPNPDNSCNLTFHYWWYAHTIDSLADAYKRSENEVILIFIQKEYSGLVFRNGGQPTNLLYDDMEWLALALLRAYQLSNREQYVKDADILWQDIKKGWNEQMGGGIAWHKEKLYYKNTPANGPAIILAARFYQLLGREEDLHWAKKIFHWLDQTLVNKENGFVMDGMNRMEDGLIDDWEFTYCQGVYIGACVELYRITKERDYLKKAILTAETAFEKLTDREYGVLQSEGSGDGGLFKGIMVRYLTELIITAPEETHALVGKLETNGERLWKQGKDHQFLFSHHWAKTPDMSAGVSLSEQLSGVMLFECLATLEKQDLL